MPYTSLADMTDRYGERLLIELTDRGEPPANAIDTDVVDRALADADAMIDGFVRARYDLPLAEVPPLLVDLAQAIAIWKLHIYEPGPKIEADYKDARETLRMISSGAIRLPVSGGEPAGTGGGGAVVIDRERPMSEDNLKGFI